MYQKPSWPSHYLPKRRSEQRGREFWRELRKLASIVAQSVYIERLNALNFCRLSFYFLVFWCHSCWNICKLSKEKE